jgi:hypothetical protein
MRYPTDEQTSGRDRRRDHPGLREKRVPKKPEDMGHYARRNLNTRNPTSVNRRDAEIGRGSRRGAALDGIRAEHPQEFLNRITNQNLLAVLVIFFKFKCCDSSSSCGFPEELSANLCQSPCLSGEQRCGKISGCRRPRFDPARPAGVPFATLPRTGQVVCT